MSSSTSLTSQLDKLYTNPSGVGALSGINSLYKAARSEGLAVTREAVRDFLARKKSYTLHKLQDKKFKRRKTVARAPNIIGQSDLADLSLLSSSNDGIKYLVVLIDVFSRYLAVRGLRKKDGVSVARALEEMLDGPFHRISRLQTDRGREYYNRNVSELLKRRKIVLYSTYSQETKAAIAERSIQTLKRRIFRYLTEHETQRYIDILPNLVQAYNNSRHSALKATPAEVHALSRDDKRVKALFNHLYKPTEDKKKSLHALQEGDTVRISLESRTGLFAKGYKIVNSQEIFRIHRIDRSQKPELYFLEDLTGEKLTGGFYREEIIQVIVPKYHPVEVLKKTGGRLLVRWLGYPNSSDTWIDKHHAEKKEG